MSNPLGDLISRGEGGYNSYNRGTQNGKILGANQEIDFTQMSIAEIQRRQNLPAEDPDRVFAVGKFQVIPTTMSEIVSKLRVDTSRNSTADMQERMFADHLIRGKRPDIYRYIAGDPAANLHAAQKAASMEWASVEDPDTPGSCYLLYAKHGNKMSTTAAQIAAVLNEMRAEYKSSIEKGLPPNQAWQATISMGPGQFQPHSRGVIAGNSLKQGENRPEVRASQESLSILEITDASGQSLHVDGAFGKSTKEALEVLQRQRGLLADGIAGADTLNALRPNTQIAFVQQAGSRFRSFDDVMNTMLPHHGGKAPHVTGAFGEHRAKRPHGGVDFNYVGGQSGINLQHPIVHAPIEGEVIFAGGQFGTVKIRDAQGYTHELLHLNTHLVKEHQRVRAGDPIGTMGGRGPDGANDYAQHVHYQMKRPSGGLINPQAFWDGKQHGKVETTHERQEQVIAHEALADGAVASEVLRKGQCDPMVQALQENLNKLGFTDARGHALRVDGDFGLRTQAAVMGFQREHGLRVDGIAGPRTLDALETQVRIADLHNETDKLKRQAQQSIYSAARREQDMTDHAGLGARYSSASIFMGSVEHDRPAPSGAASDSVVPPVQHPASEQEAHIAAMTAHPEHTKSPLDLLLERAHRAALDGDDYALGSVVRDFRQSSHGREWEQQQHDYSQAQRLAQEAALAQQQPMEVTQPQGRGWSR